MSLRSLSRLGISGFLFLSLLGALGHLLILGRLGVDRRNLDQLRIGLSYDLMHAALLVALFLLVALLFGGGPKATARVFLVGMWVYGFFVFVDFTYFTQFGTHLPFSTLEYLTQLNEFGSTVSTSFLSSGFLLLFVLPGLLWSLYSAALWRLAPQWLGTEKMGRNLVFWLLLGAVFGIWPNSKVDKNLNHPLSSDLLIYFYWSRGFEKEALVPKPEAELERLKAELEGEPPKDPRFVDYPLVRLKPATGCRQTTPLALSLCAKPRPNILFLLMESNRAGDMTSYGSKLDLTPGFEALKKEGIFFRHFFANGFQTRNGEESTFCSLVPNYGASVMKDYLKNHFRCLPQMLQEQRYQTSVVFGTSAAFDNQDRFLPAIGFASLLDSLAFDPKAEQLGWGFSDRATFEFWLQHLHQQKEPFFSAALTITNHHPFEVPPAFRVYGSKDDQHRYFESMAYSDRQFYEFIQKAKQEPWWANTLVFVLADTSNYQKPQEPYANFYDRVQMESQIPLLVLGGAVGRPMEVEGYFDQIDLAPTVMDLLGQPYLAAFAGHSLLDPRPGLAMSNRPGDYWALWTEGASFVKEADHLGHLGPQSDPELARSLESLGGAWVKAQHWLLQEDKLWPPEVP